MRSIWDFSTTLRVAPSSGFDSDWMPLSQTTVFYRRRPIRCILLRRETRGCIGFIEDPLSKPGLHRLDGSVFSLACLGVLNQILALTSLNQNLPGIQSSDISDLHALWSCSALGIWCLTLTWRFFCMDDLLADIHSRISLLKATSKFKMLT